METEVLKNRTVVFFKEWLPLLNSYYDGSVNDFPTEAINVLNSLNNDLKNKLVSLSEDEFDTISKVEELYLIEHLLASLVPIFSLDRWLRATPAKASKFTSASLSVILSQNEASSRWVSDMEINQFISNDLLETDYDIDGGTEIILNQDTQASYVPNKLTSVVDLSSQELRKGKDILLRISLSEANQDIVTVTGNECVKQQINTLFTLKPGDLASFPGLGISKNQSIGVSRNMLNLPVMLRTIDNLIATDDYLLPAFVSEASFENDNVKISFSIPTVDNQLPNILVTI